MRPNFGPLGGLNPYPVRIFRYMSNNIVCKTLVFSPQNLDGAAPGGPLGQLGNLMAPGLNAGLGGRMIYGHQFHFSYF